MTNRRLVTAVVLASCLLGCLPGAAQAQDALSRAKGFYESADYEEALQLLETLKGKSPNTEVAAYQVFCLVALGRKDEARAAIEAIVRTNPLFRPSDAQVSPRIRTFFEDVRRPLLPEIARQSYTSAKAFFDAKQWAAAQGEFDLVVTLLDQIGGTEPGASDLRTLAVGFRDLARAAAVPPPPPAPVAPAPELPREIAPPSMAPVAPAEPVVYGPENQDVKRPFPLSKPLPAWHPVNVPIDQKRFVGAVELLIDEEGKVLATALVDSVHPQYDALLLEAAKAWTFRPATKNGVPVRYRYALAVQLER